MNFLKGRVTIVTDATNRIGRAAALPLASLGASISLIHSSGSSFLADSLASEINNFGSAPFIPRAIGICGDLSNPEGVRSVFNSTEKFFKCRPHIVFHSACALYHYYYFFSSTLPFKFDSIMSANARNAFLVLREAANRVTNDGSGRILARSSSLVEMNRPGYAIYTASNAAVEVMVKTLTNEFQEKKIRITANCIAPWQMEEDAKTPLPGPMMDIDSMLDYLCSDQGELVNGEVIRVKDILESDFGNQW